ncbi:DUF4123 domain-containing protein [Collimonas antrihumi]|uniref:DUF4123 domain-containing protein n=1 Tax=Collimonas antrihumi TaxID=1940615 RepID=UPI001B8B7265|nr:DUF4123 domain-containing protein [Collimonas antrihumi]
MYFGVDPHHPELNDLILTTAGELVEKYGKLYMYALVDGAFDDDVGLRLWKHSQQSDSSVVSLYDNTRLSGYEECSPFLLNLTQKNLPPLLAASEGKPMFSILQSPLTIDALQRHFAAFLQIRTTSDGLCMLVRFADTMCSQNMLNMFNDAQRSAFCSGFTAWHLINRKGTLTTIDGTCLDATAYTPPVIGEDNAIDITDRQYVGLIDSSEADFILCNFAETVPQIVVGRTASTLYTMIAGLLKEMDLRGIKKDTDRRNLIVDALMMPDRYQALALLDAAQEHGVDVALQRAS